MGAIQEIKDQGWTQVDFAWPIERRAHYTKLGNELITQITQNDRLRQAFTFALIDSPDKRAHQANLFTVSPALNSADDKLWFHVGYQTREHVNSVIPESEQSDLIKEFLNETDELLIAIEVAFRSSLQIINAQSAVKAIFSHDELKRAIHIRFVRYNNARTESAPDEPVTGHADMSLCTLHLFETHGHWFQAAPYDQSIIIDEDSSERRAAVKSMRSKLKVITEVDEKAIFFLGAGWKNLSKGNPPQDYQLLPACYHAGIRPTAKDEYISPYALDVTGNDVDRVSLVVFAQPSLEYIKSHDFKYATVAQCRPDTAVVI